jgi:hypothetical protein
LSCPAGGRVRLFTRGGYDWADRFLKWTRFSRYENSNWIQ